MKYILIAIASITLYSTSAQVVFNTGSAQLDADLSIINNEAGYNFVSYRATMGSSYHVSESKIDYMRTTIRMAPAEIYLSLELSRLTNKPIDRVISIYQVDKNKGWGHIAKQMGIKPGSAEFHQLKRNTTSIKNNGTYKKRSKNNPKAKGKSKSKSNRKSFVVNFVNKTHFLC